MERILIIGGGGTGAALAHDLTLRGFHVSLFEKGEYFSGTTGRHHGLLHSGGRYAVGDAEAARECIEENRILRRLAPQAIEQNEGLFVALDEKDLEFSTPFIDACKVADIPIKILTAQQALALEPGLNPGLKLAIQVPDATFDAWRLPLHFLATAKVNGAKLHHFTETIGIHTHSGTVNGIRVLDHTTGQERDEFGDLVVNAAGAWSGRVTALASVNVPIRPGPGVMVAIKQRVTNMVINRLHPAGEGDIIVPQRKFSVLGTSLWLADDPDKEETPHEHIQRMIDLCAEMVPEIPNISKHSAWSASRPLIGAGEYDNPQQISRTFDCFDHKTKDNVEGFLSIIGGKATTLRAMAEKTADLVCQKLARDIPCKTKETPLVSYRRFYQ
ncbi:FAD-dependent oxidoreductase [candidate division KSB3 bacterium]|uniref:FAD-dependent oxidoreductase n=1 Tax=candidate division KSB3 bacterium TaxID=2044937 RepID=A0A2G6KE44_9BACT|nr:MAG: FAD-dependent oxidoreductase [candidate division KSB3 bacterium]